MELLQLVVGILAVSAGLMGVMGTPVPGVTVENKTASFCSDLKIRITDGCLNTFVIDNSPYAQVDKRGDATSQHPFEFHKEKGEMQLLNLRNFTVEISCDVGDSRLSVKIIDYQLIPCPTPPGAAALVQGSFLSFLLPMALMMRRIY